MTTTRSKADLLAQLRAALRAMLVADANGEAHPRLARSHGFVDGYMRVLLDGGLATQQELLALVADERAAMFGPSTAELEASRAERADVAAA
jgi:hypothetical protein